MPPPETCPNLRYEHRAQLPPGDFRALLGSADLYASPNCPASTAVRAASLRVPVALLESIKIEANRRDVPYQSLIKLWLAEKAG